MFTKGKETTQHEYVLRTLVQLLNIIIHVYMYMYIKITNFMYMYYTCKCTFLLLLLSLLEPAVSTGAMVPQFIQMKKKWMESRDAHCATHTVRFRGRLRLVAESPQAHLCHGHVHKDVLLLRLDHCRTLLAHVFNYVVRTVGPGNVLMEGGRERVHCTISYRGSFFLR